jgi:hypothetical protein
MAIVEGCYIERSRSLALIPVGIEEGEGLHYPQLLDWQKKWLYDRYKTLNFSTNFDAWYGGVKDDPHRLDVAISGIKRTLWDKLAKNNCKDAFYYCVLRNEDGIYKIRIDKENISIDPKILKDKG